MTQLTTQNNDTSPSVINSDLDTIKSVYYWLNAKPDTSIKVFKDAKEVSIADINSLNGKIQTKLSTEELFTNITSLDIVFDKGVLRSFGSWEEFQRTSWEIAEKTESISIVWDINIKLPNYKLPQRHTVKVRIGSSIRPGELFQIMTSSDDDLELIESTSFIVCKVDFVNSTISSELIAIVEEWYNCLVDIEPKSGLQKFIESNRQNVSRVCHYLLPLTGLILLFVAFKLHISKLNNIAFDKGTYTDFYFWMLLIFVVYFAFNFIGSLFGQRIFELINKLEDSAVFNITKGDKNSQQNIIRKNKSLLTQVKQQFWLTIGGTFLSIILTKVIDQVLK